MTQKSTLFLLILLFVSLGVQAQVDTANGGKFTMSGYLDSYYFGNFNNPSSRSNLGVAGNARAFDQVPGQFNIGLVQTKFVYSNSKSEGVIDLTFGPNSDLGNYGNVVGPLGSGKATTALAIKQAYFTYKASDKLSFTAGQFGTHIGYEVIDAPINYNYSLSNLFNNGPFYHIGVKGTYAFSDKASLMVGVVNNVDNLNDNNRAKGVISQFFFSPVEGWNVYLNWIGSNEAAIKSNGKDSTGYYSLFDLTTGYQITDDFYVGLNAAYGSQKANYQGVGQASANSSNSWGGVAFYSNYSFSDVFGMGIRLETFDNTGGARALRNFDKEGTNVNSYTLTANIKLASEHLLIKPELRVDSYKKNKTNAEQFMDSDGIFSKTSQATLGLAFIYKF
jgi:hypothetical protein